VRLRALSREFDIAAKAIVDLHGSAASATILAEGEGGEILTLARFTTDELA
jgi:hypothetical protein